MKGSGNISAGRNPGFLVFPILTKKDSARGADPLGLGPQAPFNLRSRRHSMKTFALLSGLALLLILAMQTHVAAEATGSKGSIQGTISDPKGGVVPDARITVTNKATGHVDHLTTTQTGAFNAGTLTPGDYSVRVEVKGFKTSETTVRVEVGVVYPLNLTLQLGSENTVINVEATAFTVNTQQAIVQDVLTADQIEDLPVNGRNFLDLASLDPGVQIQHGATFVPTKTGFSSSAFGGHA